MKQRKIGGSYSERSEGRALSLRLLHKYVITNNILLCDLAVGMFNYMESGRVTGSRILDDRNSLQAYVASNNVPFTQMIAVINKKDLSRIKDIGIFQHKNDPSPHVFYYHANKYNSDDRQDVQEFIAEQLHQFHSTNEASYSIAYMHSNFVDFLVFRRFVEKWPEHFFRRLRRIYIVGPSLMVRFIQKFSIGTFYRLCDQIFLNIPGMRQLKQQETAALKLLGENTPFPTPTPKPPTIGGVQVIQNGLYGKILSEYDLYMGKYPKILLRLLARIIKNPTQLHFEGIFRKSCNSEELEKLEDQILLSNWQAINQQEDILVVCGCLKKIMNNLSLPLFNYKIYDRVINFSGGEENTFIRSLLSDMEYVNHKVFLLLLVFLSDFVVKQQEVNKMSGYNLSVVFGPCFFRPQVYDLKDLINSGKFVKILSNCFEHQQQIIEEGDRKLAESILKALQEGSLNIDAEI